MKFYTNIQLIGNQFLIRGYENGKHITHREEWKPTLFVPSKRKTKYKTLEGDSVEPIQPGFVRDCREFYKKYDEVENFKIYGNDRYVYQYISEKYPEDHINFDIKKIRLVTIDIEVAAESGFPDVLDYDGDGAVVISWVEMTFRNRKSGNTNTILQHIQHWFNEDGEIVREDYYFNPAQLPQ